MVWMRYRICIVFSAMVVAHLTPPWTRDSRAESTVEASFPGTIETSPTSAYRTLVVAACPGTHLTVRDLELAALLQRKYALARAVRGDREPASSLLQAKGGSDPLHPFTDDPRVAARVIQRDFGPDSLVTRSAQGVLALASVAERGSQVPLDRINVVADAIVEAGRQVLGMPSLPALRFRSHLGHEQAGVKLSASW